MTIAQIHQMDDTIEKLKTEHNEKKKPKEETVKTRSKANCKQFFNSEQFFVDRADTQTDDETRSANAQGFGETGVESRRAARAD